MMRPIFLPPNRVWRTYPGGKILDKIEGKKVPQDSHFPEDWIASTTGAVNKGRETIIDEGISRLSSGQLLTNVLMQNPIEVLGKSYYEKYRPSINVLVKFLDSAVRLHFQCHPIVEFSRKYLNSNYGKTEAYYILDFREEISEPYIYLGFQHPPTKEEWRKIIENQCIDEMEACFDKIILQKGDVFLVPGGLPHAIGEGVLMVEIMEPTDFAVRVEFEKGGYVLPESARFMNRGIDFAIEMFDYQAFSTEEIRKKFSPLQKLLKNEKGGKEISLIDRTQTPCFSVNKIIVHSAVDDEESESFYIGIVTKGQGHMVVEDEVFSLKYGDKFLKPFSLKKVQFVEGKTDFEILKILPPL